MTRTRSSTGPLALALAASLVASTLAGAGLTGCSGAPKAKQPMVARTIEKAGAPSITVSDDDAGASIVLQRGQDLFVRLEHDGTSDYEWSLVDRKTGVLAVVSSQFERSLRSETASEAVGDTVWHLRPQAAGSVVLTFDQRVPRRLDPPLRTVTYSVTVR